MRVRANRLATTSVAASLIEINQRRERTRISTDCDRLVPACDPVPKGRDRTLNAGDDIPRARDRISATRAAILKGRNAIPIVRDHTRAVAVENPRAVREAAPARGRPTLERAHVAIGCVRAPLATLHQPVECVEAPLRSVALSRAAGWTTRIPFRIATPPIRIADTRAHTIAPRDRLALARARLHHDPDHLADARATIGTLLASAAPRPTEAGRGAADIHSTTTSAATAPGRRSADAREDRMDAKARRKLEMGARALEFSRAHPDTSPGYAAAVTRLEERLTRSGQLAAQQREGRLQVRAATQRKRELRRAMQQAHLPHLAEAGKAAAREVPELAQKFVFRPGTTSYLAFRTAARGIAAEAESQKDALVKHGLVETVLASLAQALDQFDAAVESGAEGRQAHVGASAELRAVADEVVQVVRVMDGLNRYRFMNDAESLAAWTSASNVLAPSRARKGSEPASGTTPQPGTAPAGGEVRPAA